MSSVPPRPRSRRQAVLAGLVALVVALGLILLPSASSASSRRGSAPKPTVVLVHGAFADASGWADVTTKLQRRGYTVIAPANPLRGVASDSTYIASVLASIKGPIVLAGHSYGGEVITNAALGNPQVKALVYVAAFAPAEGETSGALSTKYPGSQLTEENLVFRPFPISAKETGLDAYINPAVFREVFCADLSERTAAAMAATQRPGALSTLGEPSGKPAWKTIPSWYLVAKQDHAIPPASQRFMAQRMKAHTREINSSHVAMISHPGVVADLIQDAARATR
ncbi:MAG: alpha/beta hydrolase [Propionibacteriaceae bacterium]